MIKPDKRKDSLSEISKCSKKLKPETDSIYSHCKKSLDDMGISPSSLYKIQLEENDDSKKLDDLSESAKSCKNPMKGISQAAKKNINDEIKQEKVSYKTQSECSTILQDYFHVMLKQHKEDMHALVEQQRLQVKSQIILVEQMMNEIIREFTPAQSQDIACEPVENNPTLKD